MKEKDSLRAAREDICINLRVGRERRCKLRSPVYREMILIHKKQAGDSINFKRLV